MSTWIYLQCLDHDPPLWATSESGQHLYDLPDIRRDIATREAIVADFDRADGHMDRGYFGNATLAFLTAHRKCRIGIIDEYERTYPVEEPKAADA